MRTAPSVALRHHQTRMPKKLKSGIGKVFEHLWGWCQALNFAKLRLSLQATRAHKQFRALSSLDDQALAFHVARVAKDFRTARKIGGSLERRALAAVAEVTRRQLGLAPYRVQLMGSLALFRGYLAEMATGEGKTLSVAMAGVLAGWRGRPVHILTSNDYLAQRDCEEMQPIYAYCGVHTAFVIGAQQPDQRRGRYACDVVYTTGKELLADFLRDRLVLGSHCDASRLTARMLAGDLPSQGPVMRGIHTVLVDEADSVLIDDSVTPLIISRKVRQKTVHEAVQVAYEVAKTLHPDKDYDVNYRKREIELTGRGEQTVRSELVRMPPFYRTEERARELVQQALVAKYFYSKGVEYVVQDEKVVIIDLPTGRLKKDSTWQHGLHQAVEMKEGLPLSDAAETMASMSFQNFFRLFPRLGGLTGTARKAESEFWRIYRLQVMRIPTHRRCIRKRLRTRYFPSINRKDAAIVTEVTQLKNKGQPVLVGVGSVSASMRLSKLLQDKHIVHNVLNAEKHDQEAAIVATAGYVGAVTIATNMAGRGTDIRLAPGVRELGGLQVIAYERMDSARTDRQLEGRAARQGDPGCMRRYVAMDDDLLIRALPKVLLNVVGKLLQLQLPGARLLAALLTQFAQRKSENRGRSQREGVIRRDRWLQDSLPFRG